jgi:hypothetical protein
LVDRLAVNYRHAELDRRDHAMLDFAVKMTSRVVVENRSSAV